VARSTVTIRTGATFAGLTVKSACCSADCMMPTSVRPSGVMVRPSMPSFGTRLDSSAGRLPSNGESRSICRPRASKWVMNGPYSSDT
jgi:hypothetical protein